MSTPATFVRESSVVFNRQMRMNLRNPAWVFIGIMQPVLYLVLFGPLLKPLVSSFGTDIDPYTFLVPGLLVQLGLFGAFFAGFGLIGEWRDVVQLFVQAVILVALGVALGMRASVAGVVGGIALTLLIGGACAAASNALALTTKSEDVMAPVINVVMMPVLLLSGILLPMTLGPAWLQTVSDFMPFRWIVDAVRGGFAGELAGDALAWGVGWSVVLFGLALWWGTAVFRKENA